MELPKKTLQFINHHQLIERGETILVGVSGGPDSVALLHCLYALRHVLGIQLHVVHYNHHLRTSSDRDEAFVQSLCEKLDVPLTIEGRKVLKSSKKMISEDTARQLRISFFVKVAGKLGAKKIALAHTQNDLAETVLLRLLRGAGLSGMRGILSDQMIEGLRVVRPFLKTPRSQIEGFLHTGHLKSCVDESNLQPVYLRNKVRLKLLPLLTKDYNSNISGLLLDLASTSQADYDFLLHQANLLFDKKCRVSSLKVEIGLQVMKKQHLSMRRMLLRLAFETLVSNLYQLDFNHLEEVEDTLFKRTTGRIVHWPQGISVLKDKNKLIISRDTKAKA